MGISFLSQISMKKIYPLREDGGTSGYIFSFVNINEKHIPTQGGGGEAPLFLYLPDVFDFIIYYVYYILYMLYYVYIIYYIYYILCILYIIYYIIYYILYYI